MDLFELPSKGEVNKTEWMKLILCLEVFYSTDIYMST